MFRKLMPRIVLSAAIALSVMVPAAPAFAGTNVFGDACKGGKGGDSAVCQTPSGGKDPLSSSDGILHTATNLIAIIAGVAAVIVMIWAGIQYITSNGDAEAVSKAKRTIIFAAAGLVIIVVGRAIIAFVLSKI